MRILKKLHALALELLQRPKMFKLHMPRIRWHVKKLVPGILALAIIFSLITFLRPQGAGDGTIPRRSQASGNVGP